MPQVGWLVAAKLLSVWLLGQLSGAIVTQMLAGPCARARGTDDGTVFDWLLRCYFWPWVHGAFWRGSMMTAVIVFIIYGLLLSLVWVRLDAIDVALTEAAIGSGVTGMLADHRRAQGPFGSDARRACNRAA